MTTDVLLNQLADSRKAEKQHDSDVRMYHQTHNRFDTLAENSEYVRHAVLTLIHPEKSGQFDSVVRLKVVDYYRNGSEETIVTQYMALNPDEKRVTPLTATGKRKRSWDFDQMKILAAKALKLYREGNLKGWREYSKPNVKDADDNFSAEFDLFDAAAAEMDAE